MQAHHFHNSHNSFRWQYVLLLALSFLVLGLGETWALCRSRIRDAARRRPVRAIRGRMW